MTQIPTPQELESLHKLAKYIQKSSKFKTTPPPVEDIFIALLMAKELNMPLMSAATGGIHIYMGKVELGAHMMGAKIREAGGILDINSTDDYCEIKAKRADGNKYTAKFTMEDAKRGQLLGKGMWKRFPAEMLYTKCISRICRVLFPDTFGTPIYGEGEIDMDRESPEESFDVVRENFIEEKQEITIEDKMQYLYSLFPNQDDLFAKFVLEKAHATNITTEEMYSEMYKKKEILQQRFNTWLDAQEKVVNE